MSDHLHDPFLPYTAEELRKHFVYSKGEEDPADKYLAHWRDRIEKWPSKFAAGDQSWLERDETFWTPMR